MRDTESPSACRQQPPSRGLLQAALWIGSITVALNAWLISQH